MQGFKLLDACVECSKALHLCAAQRAAVQDVELAVQERLLRCTDFGHHALLHALVQRQISLQVSFWLSSDKTSSLSYAFLHALR